MGQILYKDINIITTPLYQFIMSSLLLIKDSYLIFCIEQFILCTILFFFLEKLTNKKAYLLISLLLFPIFYFIFPNYNFVVFLILIKIIYFEKEEKNDLLIRIFLGLLILSKHSVGRVIIYFIYCCNAIFYERKS